MEDLVSMGFSEEKAAEALAATGGKSALQATEWILSQSNTPPLFSNISSLSSSSQSKLNRFFPSKNPSYLPDQQKEEGPLQKKKRIPEEEDKVKDATKMIAPLSDRMRPRTLDEVIGQEHLHLIRTVQNHRLPSIVLWGPAGSGKTSIAKAITASASYRFVTLSAITSGVKDIREAIDGAQKNRKKQTLLFVDEVHRFNKSQQDSFLPFIEDGTIVFIGATTENPSFHLVTPLLSRSTVLSLNPLSPSHLQTILRRAISDEDRGLPRSFPAQFSVKDEAVEFISQHSDGDARVALNALEVAATSAFSRIAKDQSVGTVTLEDAKEAMQNKHVAYDRDGEEHYNLISALHKSMRGSDADAAIYWLARMVEGGEQPLYIARRLVRFASEDIGLADPQALNQAVACYQACHFIGMPECDAILAQCAAYLALAPKSVAVYKAISAARKAVRASVGQNEGVPLHLRNAPTRLMKDLGYGKDYIYTPNDPSAYQSFLPDSLKACKFLDWPPH